MRAGGKRLKLGKIYVYYLVIHRVGIGCERDIIRLSALGAKKFARRFVGREYRGRGAELGAHIRYRGTLGNAQVGNALSAPLDDLADAALYRNAAQKLKDDILGSDPRAPLARKPHEHHFRHRHAISAAAHCNGNVKPARAEGEHAYAARRGRVPVGAHKSLAGNAEALKVDLVANAVAGARIVNAVFCRHGAEVFVIVGILKAGLERVVIDVCDRQFCLYAVKSH